MIFECNDKIRTQIYALRDTLGLTDFSFEVDSEQAFLKKKDLDPKTIYVLTRRLQNDNGIGVDTQPVQILVLSEQNDLDIARSFFSEFAKKYNFDASIEYYKDEYGNDHSMWVKQQYSDPVVLSNFNTVSYGYRSVIYMPVTYYAMYDVVDLRDLKIDGKEYKALTFDFAYTMTPNTQQLSGTGEFISSSAKSSSSLALTLTLPVVSSNLITKILKIMDENDPTSYDADWLAYGGNENFYFDFYLGGYHFQNKKMKLVSADFGAAVNNIPAIRIGFVK